jgi:dTDP-4-dehydrorhamnose reductase
VPEAGFPLPRTDGGPRSTSRRRSFFYESPAVDDVEDDAVAALEVNAFGVRSLARAAAATDATLVHYGTDFVFDGTASEPYREDDAPNPQSVYATSKLLGEWFAQGARHYVLRVESLFGGGVNGPRADGRRPGGSLDRIAGALLDGSEVRAFVDRIVSPSYVEDVAAATVSLLRAAPAHGLYHCVGSGHATWFEVTRELAERLGVEPAIRGITLDELELRAPRPRFCALSNRKLAAAGVEMPHWRDALARYAGIRLRFGPA